MNRHLTHSINPQALNVIDGIGDFIEYWGFKKIHGKIWAIIFLAEKPVDAKYIINNLEVSKALVSMSLKDLLAYEVILESKEKKSTLHYESNPYMGDVIMNVLMNREARLLSQLKSSCELLNCLDLEKIQPSISQARSKKLSQMVNMADTGLKTFLKLQQFNFKEMSKTLNMKRHKGGRNGA